VREDVCCFCRQILHGEQYLELLAPINTEGTLEVHCKVADVLDKGSGTVVLVEGKTLVQRAVLKG
jgi:hypothetical protein